MSKRGFIPFLRDFAAGGGILIGVSAGAILMTPRIDAAALCGDPVVAGLDTASLKLVGWEFLPHFGGSREEEREKVERYCGRSGIALHACGDGSGIIVSGNRIEFIGRVESYRNGVWTAS